MGEMTIEQQRAIALASARLRLKQSTAKSEDPPAPSSPSGFTPTLGAIPLETYMGVLTGATGTLRGGLNLLSGEKQLGSKIWPPAEGSAGTVAKTVGEFADPLSYVIAGGVGKVLPMASVFGKGIAEGVVTTGKNILSGAATGGTIGALSDEGSAGSGASVGAVAGGALPFALGGAAKLIGKAWDMIVGRYGINRAGEIVRAAAGGDIRAMRAAFMAAPDDVTAAQAAAGIKNDVFNALSELAAREDRTNYYSRLAARQAERRIEIMQRMAGGANQTEARQVAEQSKKALGEVTKPMRETAIEAANEGRKAVTLGAESERLGEAAAAKVEDVRRLSQAGEIAEDVAQSGRGRLDVSLPGNPPAGGQPRLSGRYGYGTELAEQAERAAQKAADDSLILGEAGRFAKRQAESVGAHGFNPLDSGKIVNSIVEKINNPRIGVEDLNRRVLSRVAIKIRDWTERGRGVIDAAALYEIRKSAVTNEVERLLGNADPATKAKRAAGILTQIKPLIDDAIVKAAGPEGGKMYLDYLRSYERGMHLIGQQQLGAKALDMLQRSPKDFVRLVEGNNPKVVEKVFETVYDIEKAMGPQKYAQMRGVAEELSRDESIREGAGRATGALGNIIADYSVRFTLPNWIDHNIAITNKVLSMMEKRLGRSTVDALVKGLRSGRGAKELLDSVSAADRLKIFEKLSPYMGAGIVSATQ